MADSLDRLETVAADLIARMETVEKSEKFLHGDFADQADINELLLKRTEALRAAFQNAGHGDVFAYEKAEEPKPWTR